MDPKRGLEYVSQALAPAGLVAYALVYVAYDKFYKSLGLNPSDLGLTFTTVLERSVTLYYAIGLNAILAAPALYFVLRIKLGKSVMQKKWNYLRVLQITLIGNLIWLFFGIHVTLDRAIQDVRLGNVVLPFYHPATNTTLLHFRADAVTVTDVGPVTPKSAVDGISSRELLYLGSDNSDPASAWFYDYRAQSSFRMALSSIIIEIANCDERDFPNPRCSTVAGRDGHRS